MFPRWLSWLFVLFLGYVIVTGNRGLFTQDDAPEHAARNEHVQEYYPAIHALVDGERWKRAINPTYTEEKPCAPAPSEKTHFGSYAILEQQGAGDLAECGQTIRFSATVWNTHGEPDSTIAHRDITLGEQPGLDALLVSMAVSETRTLMLTVPHDGYKTLPELSKGAVQMLRVTREAIPDDAEKEKAGH